VGRGPQTAVGRSEPAIFSNFCRDIFGAYTAEANIIMQHHIMKCLIGFPVTLKWLTLNDNEMPFYAKICFHCRFA